MFCLILGVVWGGDCSASRLLIGVCICDLGVVLRISFAAGAISPLTNLAREKKSKEFALLPLHIVASDKKLCVSCFRFGRPVISRPSISGGGFGVCLEFWKEACGPCSFISSVGFLC